MFKRFFEERRQRQEDRERKAQPVQVQVQVQVAEQGQRPMTSPLTLDETGTENAFSYVPFGRLDTFTNAPGDLCFLAMDRLVQDTERGNPNVWQFEQERIDPIPIVALDENRLAQMILLLQHARQDMQAAQVAQEQEEQRRQRERLFPPHQHGPFFPPSLHTPSLSLQARMRRVQRGIGMGMGTGGETDPCIESLSPDVRVWHHLSLEPETRKTNMSNENENENENEEE